MSYLFTTALAGQAFSFAGMGFLCVAMERTHYRVYGKDALPWKRALLRFLGTGALITALIACIAGWNATVGIVLWIGSISIGALCTLLMATYLVRGILLTSTVFFLNAAALFCMSKT